MTAHPRRAPAASAGAFRLRSGMAGNVRESAVQHSRTGFRQQNLQGRVLWLPLRKDARPARQSSVRRQDRLRRLQAVHRR